LKNKAAQFFKGRKIIIATRHHKEKVIAPLLESELGVTCIVPDNLDTDSLGTFTGEVERADDPLSTARKKCQLAMDMYECDLAIANEGSFGPHPFLVFVPADEEIIVLSDRRLNIEIRERELSNSSNFSASDILSEDDLWTFAQKAGFPSHGIILRKAKTEFTGMVKGITNAQELLNHFHYLQENYGQAYAETDMRALYNPTRMKVIESATRKLLAKINSLCPSCNMPGFGITSVKTGLPCKLCGQPTRSVLSHLYLCESCKYSKELVYPNQKKFEDPMYCDNCNP
jgi:hypothetical protein